MDTHTAEPKVDGGIPVLGRAWAALSHKVLLSLRDPTVLRNGFGPAYGMDRGLVSGWLSPHPIAARQRDRAGDGAL